MIDTHCHLTYPGLIEIQEKILEEARKKMSAIVTCGYPKDAEQALKLAQEHGFVFLTLGLHPIDVIKMSDRQIEGYKQLVIDSHDKIIGIGEIGLDNHWIKEDDKKERCRSVFEDFLELSKELKLPVVLHTRKAEQECFELVLKHNVKRVYFHCYGGGLTLAKDILEQNFIFGIATNIANSKNTKKIAEKYPLENLFTETDSPFLSPYPGKPNVPWNVELVLEKMSGMRGLKKGDVDEQIMANAEEFFRIKIKSF